MFNWLKKSNITQSETTPPEVAPVVSKPLAEPPLPSPTINLDQDVSDEAFSHGVLSRQVIVDRAYHPTAYEFGLRKDNTHRDIPSSRILAGLLGRLSSVDLSAGRQSWLRLSDTELIESPAETMALSHSVLIIELTATDAETVSHALQTAGHLKAEGCQFALADWQDDERHHAWLPLCDFVEVRNNTHNPADVGRWPERLRVFSPEIKLVACDVDSWEALEFCHRQKYDYFRGHFLTHRENWPRQPKISPERARLIDLLNRFQLGAELSEIAEQLKQSPELSYRLLRYINSAGVSSGSRIASIQQGLMILGRDRIYRWLTLLLFTSNNGQSLDSALLEQALVRARLMELLSSDRLTHVQRDELFVVGIFSLLDMLLRLPMSVAIEPLKLPAEVESALLDSDKHKGDYSLFLKLAIACEDGDLERLKLIAAQLAIPVSIINSYHLDALVWTQQTLIEK